jgi:hypothetical protein
MPGASLVPAFAIPGAHSHLLLRYACSNADYAKIPF